MSSVTNPDIEFNPQHTRLGEWYYGTGQELRDRASFRAIEEPHRNMHEAGAHLLQHATEGQREEFSQMLKHFNTQFENISNALNRLQAELVAEEPFRK
ncbi:MAG: CZB domain-containing protein [Halioglobus sp.]|nr:CZB domain-containing protein [Halioglobus sp.]